MQFILREVNEGWLIRAYHATGTGLMFAMVYVLLFRGILTRGYRAPGELVWLLGVALFALLLLAGWLGFVLTGGAVGGEALRRAADGALALGGAPGAVGLWLFGGAAGAGTLLRMEVFHAVLGLALGGVALLHWAARNAIRPKMEGAGAVSFYPYYLAQYVAALAVFALIFALLLGFAPGFGGVWMNALPPGALMAPGALPLPWYLAPLGALGAVLPGAWGAVAAVAVLFALPWLDRNRGRPGRWLGRLAWVLALDVLGLGLSCAPWLTALLAFWYFFHFLVLTPLVSVLEAA